jgi:hypothetical protein
MYNFKIAIIMKKNISIFSSILVVGLLAFVVACSDQYDNIKQYATSETVYVGGYTEPDPNADIAVGHNRIVVNLGGTLNVSGKIAVLDADGSTVIINDSYWRIGGLEALDVNNPKGDRRLWIDRDGKPAMADDAYKGEIYMIAMLDYVTGRAVKIDDKNWESEELRQDPANDNSKEKWKWAAVDTAGLIKSTGYVLGRLIMVKIDTWNSIMENKTGKKAVLAKTASQWAYIGDELGPYEIQSWIRGDASDLYLGKATKTVVEYDEVSEHKRVVIDSVCTSVNITGLTTPKIYTFTIYTEDEYGNRSIPVLAYGRPFTDEDMKGYTFPLPSQTATPATMDFYWTKGLAVDDFYNFAGLTYAYTDGDNQPCTGELQSGNRISVINLRPGEVYSIALTLRVIPILNGNPILDTVTITGDFEAQTVSKEEYLAGRTARSFDPFYGEALDGSAKIVLAEATEHLVWTEIQYATASGNPDSVTVRITADQTEINLTDVKRGSTMQYRSGYKPEGIDEDIVTEWEVYDLPFMIKYDRSGWSVISERFGNLYGEGSWGDGSLNGTRNAHLFDDDPWTGKHSDLSGYDAMPRVIVIDMQGEKEIAQVVLQNRSEGFNGQPADNGYWKDVEVYITDERVTGDPPRDVPASWTLIGTYTSPGDDYVREHNFYMHPINAALGTKGSYLIIRWPNNNIGWAGYVNIFGVIVYGI